MSSLATQLQSIASLDASRLISRSGVPTSKSYLFPPKTAASHDLDAIFALAQSGFEELRLLDPGMEEFEDGLFSEAAKRTDRMMLNQEENRKLDEVLGRCLRRLGKWVGIMAGGKCIEWLVRRFRVHEMNADAVLQVFLPYQESPNFARMLAILTIPTTSPYHAPFSPLIKSAQPLPRTYIATAISPARDRSLRLLNDVAGTIKVALDEDVVHRALLAFWTSTMVELLDKVRTGKGVNEGMVKIMVEAFVTILSNKGSGSDVCAAVYPPLILLTRIVRLADGPFLALLSAIISPTSKAVPAQRLLTLLVVLDDRPGWDQGLGENGSQCLARVKMFGENLVAAMERFGFEEGLKTVLKVLVERPELTKTHLTTIFNHQGLFSSLVKLASSDLVRIGSASICPKDRLVVCKELISILRERHPMIVDAALVGQARQLGVNHDLGRPNGDMEFVSINSADVVARVEGVRALLKLLVAREEGNTEGAVRDQDVQSATEALVTRLADDEEAVIAALYEDSTALRGALSDGDRFIEAIAPAFSSLTPSRTILRHHLEFLSDQVSTVESGFERKVFERLIFPCLLRTTRRAPFMEEEISVLSNGNLGRLEVLDGLQSEVSESSEDSGENQHNVAVIRSLADSIARSSEMESYIGLLLDKLDDPLANSRLLAHYVLALLIQTLRGERQVSLAVRILQRLEPLRAGPPLRDFADLDDPLSLASLDAMLKKPDSSKTAQRTSAMLLVALAKVVRPPGEQAAWLKDETPHSVTEHTASYESFARLLYSWANSHILPSSLAITLLRSLLTQIGEDALIFFASIWTSDVTTALRLAALRHAAAFIQAHAGESATDFQLVLPGVLIALQDETKLVRDAGILVMRNILALLKNGAPAIYGLDTFYGSRSNLVQLLKHADLQRYLEALLAISAEISIDPGRLSAAQTNFLGMSRGKNRKDSSHRRAVIGSLFSHVNAWRSEHARRSLLTSLSGIADSSVFQGVLPLLSPLTDDRSEESLWLSYAASKDQMVYLEQLFATLSPQGAKAIANDEEGEAWSMLLGLLSLDPIISYGAQLRSLALQRMVMGVFIVLAQSQQVAWIVALLRSLHNLSTDEVFSGKAALQRLPLEANGTGKVIQDLLHPLEISSRAKRQKHDDDTESNRAEHSVSDLTAFIDSRDWKALPGDAPLVASLMSILSALLVKRQSVKEGVDYLEQEVLAAILAQVEKIEAVNEIQKAHVGIEVIIKVIRASTNPRTSQRALLVTAELARLIPDSVLHNAMPIFTFMGASDFQRDDAYSFGVVEKTVSRIVPVMTRSFREKAKTKLELYNESLSFVGIFTDMAGRLPKHRRLPFYVHLVKSLGPSEFLAPVVMLLVEKATTKAGRAGSSVAQAIELPLGIVAAFDVDLRLSVLLESVMEIDRLIGDVSRSDKEAFLRRSVGDSTEGDRTDRIIVSLADFTSTLARQASGKVCTQSTVEDIVQQLLLLAGMTSQPALSGFSVAVQTTLEAAMQLLSAVNFFTVVERLLDSSNDQDIKMALSIFADRLPLVKPDVRSHCAAEIASILTKTSSRLTRPAAVVSSALAGIRTVAQTALDSEDAALAQVLPRVVESVGGFPDTTNLTAALSLIDLTLRRLLSRAIPFIQPIIDSMLPMIREPRTQATVLDQAFAVLLALLETVPTFIGGNELATVLRTAITHRLKAERASSAVISKAAKNIPTKTMFPVVVELWKSLQNEDETSTKAFFDLLRLTLLNADREALPSLVKTVFAFFLDVFDLRHRLQQQGFDTEVINAIEESAIGSFLELVSKLNEATFKPLFIRLYDWAVIDLAEGKPIDDSRLIERKIVLLHVMMSLLQKFKHLLSPYIGTLLPHIEELLPAFVDSSLSDTSLWTLILDVLGKSFEVDDGAYWTDALQLKLIPLLVYQLPLFPEHTPSPVARTLASLAGSTPSEPVLKSLNTAICLTTRAENPKTRMAALRAMDAVWEKQAEEMLHFVPETVSEFLAELLEDENSEVEGLARIFLGRIEKVTGSLKEYLE